MRVRNYVSLLFRCRIFTTLVILERNGNFFLTATVQVCACVLVLGDSIDICDSINTHAIVLMAYKYLLSA